LTPNPDRAEAERNLAPNYQPRTTCLAVLHCFTRYLLNEYVFLAERLDRLICINYVHILTIAALSRSEKNNNELTWIQTFNLELLYIILYFFKEKTT